MNDAVKHPPRKPPGRARGRPRSVEARRAILRAARELIDEHGPTALTMEGIAARAGVGKPTVYRWWPDRHAVAMAALMESETVTAAPGGRSPLASLRQQLERVVDVFATPVGRAVAMMISAADRDSELAVAFRNHFILARYEEGRTLLKLALERGEIRRDANIDVALDMIYGALFFRLLMGHAPLEAAAARQILKEALQGLHS